MDRFITITDKKEINVAKFVVSTGTGRKVGGIKNQNSVVFRKEYYQV